MPKRKKGPDETSEFIEEDDVPESDDSAEYQEVDFSTDPLPEEVRLEAEQLRADEAQSKLRRGRNEPNTRFRKRKKIDYRIPDFDEAHFYESEVDGPQCDASISSQKQAPSCVGKSKFSKTCQDEHLDDISDDEEIKTEPVAEGRDVVQESPRPHQPPIPGGDMEVLDQLRKRIKRSVQQKMMPEMRLYLERLESEALSELRLADDITEEQKQMLSRLGG